ncbi:MAG: metallophosphoesterase family protein [Thermoguttaceae bacterium]
MPGRLIAIGDIHGFWDALAAILEAIQPQPEDTLIPLGDFVDRGPDSPRVLEEMLRLRQRCHLVPILGNHDELLLDLYHGAPGLEDWLSFGGKETLDSYGCLSPQDLPPEHIEFLEGCLTYHETAAHFFVHASYLPDLPLDWQPPEVLRWSSLHYQVPEPHMSGKTAIVGHTAQRDGRILDLGYLKCIDTGCYCGGWLTAMEIPSGRLWQADALGRMRG